MLLLSCPAEARRGAGCYHTTRASLYRSSLEDAGCCLCSPACRRLSTLADGGKTLARLLLFLSPSFVFVSSLVTTPPLVHSRVRVCACRRCPLTTTLLWAIPSDLPRPVDVPLNLFLCFFSQCCRSGPSDGGTFTFFGEEVVTNAECRGACDETAGCVGYENSPRYGGLSLHALVYARLFLYTNTFLKFCFCLFFCTYLALAFNRASAPSAPLSCMHMFHAAPLRPSLFPL